MTHRITVFGKGGIGKSTLSANLAAVYARRGLKVLLVGCDPKHDTTVALTEGRPIRTVVEQSDFMDSGGGDLTRVIVRGRLGVDCVESGGPEPGIGCAGRGIGRTISVLESAGALREGRYDVALFDVLGDVVCGGFAAPLRQGLGDKVVIVTSEELMALYAANNVARAVRNYADNGVALCGLVGNLRDPHSDRAVIERLAGRLDSRVLAFLPREDAVREAEYRRLTVVEHAPESGVARAVESLADALLSFERSQTKPPTPLSDEAFHELSRSGFKKEKGKKEKGSDPNRLTDETDETRPSPQLYPSVNLLGPDPAVKRASRGPDLEKLLSRRASVWEGDPGLNTQVWGSPDQWRLFFCDFETRRHARTRLEIRSPVVNIFHQDLECSFATPNFADPALPCFFSFPWPLSRQERRQSKGPSDGPNEDLMTNLRDAEVIRGGGARLEEALEDAVSAAAEHGKAIVVHSTCVPTIIGDDAGAAVARWRRRSGLPIVYSNAADAGRPADPGLELFKRIREDPDFRKVKSKRSALNLVGFPEGPALDELIELMRRSGLTVNARVLPSLDLDEARNYLAAGAQVLYPNAGFDETYRDFFEPLPIKTLKPAAPFGFDGTRRWLEEVAAAAGMSGPARTAFKRAAAGLSAQRREAREAAEGRGVAFVVDAAHLRRLTEPSLIWGVPLLRVLRELGFSVEILCFGRSERSERGLSFFETPEELERLLREGRFEAVYSEYSYDGRLSRAGKASFSLDSFELGLEGALRTSRRLSGICRWPFRRRYARYLGAGR